MPEESTIYKDLAQTFLDVDQSLRKALTGAAKPKVAPVTKTPFMDFLGAKAEKPPPLPPPALPFKLPPNLKQRLGVTRAVAAPPPTPLPPVPAPQLPPPLPAPVSPPFNEFLADWGRTHREPRKIGADPLTGQGGEPGNEWWLWFDDAREDFIKKYGAGAYARSMGAGLGEIMWGPGFRALEPSVGAGGVKPWEYALTGLAVAADIAPLAAPLVRPVAGAVVKGAKAVVGAVAKEARAYGKGLVETAPRMVPEPVTAPMGVAKPVTGAAEKFYVLKRPPKTGEYPSADFAFLEEPTAKTVKFPGFEDSEFFIHKELDAKGKIQRWVVSERSTGMAISRRETRALALADAQATLTKAGKEQLATTKVEGIKKFGVAPGSREAITMPPSPSAAPTVARPAKAVVPMGKETWEPVVVPHPSGAGYAVKVGKNSWISGGAGPLGGGNIGRFLTKEKAWAEVKRLGYIKEIPTVVPAVARPAEPLLSFLSDKPIHIDELARRSGLDIPIVSAQLPMMELKGEVKHVGGMNYVRGARPAEPVGRGAAQEPWQMPQKTYENDMRTYWEKTRGGGIPGTKAPELPPDMSQRFAATHKQATEQALAEGKLTYEQAEALGHFKTYPDLPKAVTPSVAEVPTAAGIAEVAVPQTEIDKLTKNYALMQKRVKELRVKAKGEASSVGIIHQQLEHAESRAKGLGIRLSQARKSVAEVSTAPEQVAPIIDQPYAQLTSAEKGAEAWRIGAEADIKMRADRRAIGVVPPEGVPPLKVEPAIQATVGGAPPIKPPPDAEVRVPIMLEDVKTPTEATQRVKAIQQQAPESVPLQDAKEAHVEMGAPDGPRPPKPPEAKRVKGVPPDEPADIVRQIVEKATKGERPDQTLLRLHEGAITSETMRVGVIIRDGNDKLKATGIGVMRRGQLVPREADIPKLDALNNALHNPSKVVTGEVQVPKGLEHIYSELRDRTDWTTAAMLDFDPKAATIEDYFYRGWKPPEGAFADVVQGRPLVKRPAFMKPRVNATYQEMRDLGFEPLFWNPYQQWGLRQMMGTKYREQMELVAHLKRIGDDLIKPHAGGPIPQGWRVPEVGPAFEGKPFATLDAAGEPVTMFTRRWITPDSIANTLENIYGKKPTLGKLVIKGKTIDPLAIIDWLTFMPKRAKLFGSFFQQVDFLSRNGAGSWAMMVDSLQAGKPIAAVQALARYPVNVVEILRANFSPTYRQTLAKQLSSTVPFLKGRLGVHLKGISEAGLSTIDPTMLQWDEMDKVVRMVAQETEGVKGMAKRIPQAVGDLESAMRRGLFGGVYPAAMITDIKYYTGPMVARMYPKLNDAQLSGQIARIINKKYSSIPASQSVIQNRVLRESLRRVFFSMGESEGLLRQASGAIHGPEASYWRKHWIGVYLFVIATASAIHFASTGKPLPAERFIPISKDKWGPLPFGYNTRFASPTLPFKGRGGTELTLDVVGQMDTALRILNPTFFVESRQSVPLRAGINQVSGTDFFGRPIDDVGPGGVVSRTAQLATDLFSPIGLGGITQETVRRTIPGAGEVFQEGETRLGMTGLGIQATGLNVRAATREMRVRSIHGDVAQSVLGELDKVGLDLGYVTFRFDMELGKKGGEIELTSEQREQLQWLTDDTLVKKLPAFFKGVSFQRLSDIDKKEAVQKEITGLRAEARAKFRSALKIGGIKSVPRVAPGSAVVPTPKSSVPTTPGGAAFPTMIPIPSWMK